LDILDKRWEYCKSQFQKLKDIQDTGKYQIHIPRCSVEHIMEEEELEQNFDDVYVSDKRLGFQTNGMTIVSYFCNNKEYDNGYYTPLYKWRKWFKSIKFYELSEIRGLL